MKQKNPVGRPTKQTDERVKILLECLEEAMPVEIACHYAKVSKVTFYNWLKEDENFLTQIEFARAKAERLLIPLVTAKDPWKILKNHDRKNFRDEVPEITQNNYKLIVQTDNGTIDLSREVRHTEEQEATKRIPE